MSWWALTGHICLVWVTSSPTSLIGAIQLAELVEVFGNKDRVAAALHSAAADLG